MAQKFFSIGELAKEAGGNVETIRFYQRRHLLRQPEKPFNGILHYTERDAQRIRFIKQGQKLGFTLDEVAELLSLEDRRHCREAKEQDTGDINGVIFDPINDDMTTRWKCDIRV